MRYDLIHKGTLKALMIIRLTVTSSSPQIDICIIFLRIEENSVLIFDMLFLIIKNHPIQNI